MNDISNQSILCPKGNDGSSSNEHSDRENYTKMKKEIKTKNKKPKNIGKMIKTIVNKSLKSKNAILSKVREPFEKINNEEKQLQLLKQKREMRKIQKQLGYRKFVEWDRKKERKLLKTTTRGVVKLFNSITEFRKKQKEEKEQQDKKDDKKGSNFLMMHNLAPSFRSKIYKQFEEDNNQVDNVTMNNKKDNIDDKEQ